MPTRRLHILALRAAPGVALASLAGLLAFADPTTTETDTDYIALPDHGPVQGDPEAGLRYLLQGDYIGSGIPLPAWRLLTARAPDSGPPLLVREGAEDIPHDMNRFRTPEGVDVVSGVNCLGCHASMFQGELVIGLGNSLSDWTGAGQGPIGPLKALAALAFAEGSPERVVFERFLRGSAALEGRIETPFRGVNPAFRIEEIAASHRNPADLSWSESPVFQPLDRVVPSDVPPWWHLRKKDALYYNGMGRGDFARLIQQITVFGIEDAKDAARIEPSMRDLLAYLETIEAPKYPGPIDHALAARGRVVFENNCASCHGTYGEDETYPNKLIPIEEVGTDPLYAQSLRDTPLTDWFNESWFASAGDAADSNAAYVEPELAYIAPPLDGVWCTAPYLHNASVPTLEALLDSSKRPTRWRRTFDSRDYNLERVGWNYTIPPADAPPDPKTYDTTLPGYSNQGHTYGDELTEEERRAVLEYLKGL